MPELVSTRIAARVLGLRRHTAGIDEGGSTVQSVVYAMEYDDDDRR
jgi:hypothetical protein